MGNDKAHYSCYNTNTGKNIWNMKISQIEGYLNRAGK